MIDAPPTGPNVRACLFSIFASTNLRSSFSEEGYGMEGDTSGK